MNLSTERRRDATAPPKDQSQDDRGKAGMSPDLQAHIGRHLRALFDEVAREPIPDRFLQLLNDLDKNGQNK